MGFEDKLDVRKLFKEYEKQRCIINSYKVQCIAALKANSLGLCKRIIKHALEDHDEYNK